MDEVNEIFNKYTNSWEMYDFVNENISKLALRDNLDNMIIESIAEAVAMSLCNTNRSENDIVTELYELFDYEINRNNVSKFDIHSKYEKVMKRGK